MSHIVTIRSEIRDEAAVHAACGRLGLPAAQHRTAHLFGREVTGLAVDLPDWEYPIVCDLASGQVHFDNFGGHWGEQKHLDAFLQACAVEKAKMEARRKGHIVIEQQLQDGTIKLTLQVTGGAA